MFLNLQDGYCSITPDNFAANNQLQPDAANEQGWPVDACLNLLAGQQRSVCDELESGTAEVDRPARASVNRRIGF